MPDDQHRTFVIPAYVEEENDFCNIDGVALGVQFYGIGQHHGLAEEYLRAASPENVLALTEALEAAEKRIASLNEQLADCREIVSVQAAGRREMRQRIAELEARTLTVKLPQTIVLSELAPSTAQSFCHLHRNTVKACRNALEDACCAAGIKLQIEGEE